MRRNVFFASLAAAGAVVLSAGADEIAWIGPDSGSDWSASTNWAGGVKPGSNDTAVFSGTEGTSYSVNLNADQTIAGLDIQGGNWTISASDKSGLQAQKERQFVLSGGGTGTSVVHVASTATLICQNSMRPSSTTALVFRKTGAGTFTMGGYVGSSSRIWSSLRLEEGDWGPLGGTWSYLYATNVYVCSGSTITIGGGSYPNSMMQSPHVHVEENAKVVIYSETFDGVTGTGTISGNGNNGNVTLTLSRGPYRFDGTFGGTKNEGVIFAAQGTISDENYRFVIGNANCFAASQPVKFTTGGRHPLVFPPDIGTFTFRMLGGKVGAPLNLEDTEGNPVTIVVDKHTTQSTGGYTEYPGLHFTGSGSFVTRHRITRAPFDYYGRSYTNDVFKGLTGSIGVSSQYGDMILGDNAAERDLDLSTVSAVKVLSSAALLRYQNVEKNVHTCAFDVVSGGTAYFDRPATLLGPVTGAGTYEFSAAGSTVADLRGGWTYLSILADTVLAAPHGARIHTVSVGVDDTSVVFSNGFFCSEYKIDSSYTSSVFPYNYWFPKGCYFACKGTGRRFVIDRGATVGYRYSGSDVNEVHAITLREGGTLRHPAGDTFLGASVTPEMAFEGGRYLMTGEDAGYITANMPCAQTWAFKIGAKGGTIEFDQISKFALSSWRVITLYATFEDNVASGTSGPLRFRTPCNLYPRNPVDISGPVYLDEGFLRVPETATNKIALANGTMFGSGDLHIGEAVLDLGCCSTDLAPKIGSQAGQTVWYDAGATIVGRWNGNAAQTITIGNGTGPAFRRGGKGASLVFADRQNGVTFDGTGVKVFANGTVELDPETGLTVEPIFGYGYRTGSGDFGCHSFLTYDGDRGFVERQASYTNDLAQGGVVDVTADMTQSASAEVAALRLDTQRLTLAKDVTLKIGPDDADRSAHVIFNSRADATYQGLNTGAIMGKGTVDFGKSMAVLVADRADSGMSIAPGIRCRVEGTGGLLARGTPVNTYCNVELGGDNGYSGGTWVSGCELRLNHIRALGAGDVRVGASRVAGGSVRFRAGGTITNDWYVGGFGARRADQHTTEYGALVFNAEVTLTGKIHLQGRTRIGNTRFGYLGANVFNKPGHGTLAGVISGDMLDLLEPPDDLYPLTRIDISGENTYTGGTVVAYHRVALVGKGTLGTGPVTLSNGAELQFENEAAKVFPNDMTGFGTVRLAGAGEVAFTGAIDQTGACSIKLDLADTNPRLKGLPAFAAITNTANKVARLTLTGDATLGAKKGFGGTNVRLIVDGATLDLNGRNLAFERVTCKNGGRVVNGTYAESNPAKGTMVFLK